MYAASHRCSIVAYQPVTSGTRRSCHTSPRRLTEMRAVDMPQHINAVIVIHASEPVTFGLSRVFRRMHDTFSQRRNTQHRC